LQTRCKPSTPVPMALEPITGLSQPPVRIARQILEVGRERLRVRLDSREPELVTWGQILDAPRYNDNPRVGGPAGVGGEWDSGEAGGQATPLGGVRPPAPLPQGTGGGRGGQRADGSSRT
jgi:hypothetical protein